MSGRRAPELACGKLDSVLEDIFGASLQEAIGLLSSKSTQSDLDMLVAEFETSKKTMVATLSLKFDFWKRLPWCLAGLASVNPADAQVALTKEGTKIIVRQQKGRCVSWVSDLPSLLSMTFLLLYQHQLQCGDI